jgi:hypothetical protein
VFDTFCCCPALTIELRSGELPFILPFLPYSKSIEKTSSPVEPPRQHANCSTTPSGPLQVLPIFELSLFYFIILILIPLARLLDYSYFDRCNFGLPILGAVLPTGEGPCHSCKCLLLLIFRIGKWIVRQFRANLASNLTFR